jgi:hypothetical protein
MQSVSSGNSPFQLIVYLTDYFIYLILGEQINKQCKHATPAPMDSIIKESIDKRVADLMRAEPDEI